jgi:hypothetical protein
MRTNAKGADLKGKMRGVVKSFDAELAKRRSPRGDKRWAIALDGPNRARHKQSARRSDSALKLKSGYPNFRSSICRQSIG